MESLLYLGGPIMGCTYGECTDWRKYVSEKLPPFIKAISPMRGKEHLSEQTVIRELSEKSLLTSSRGIITRDRFDVTRSSALLMNFFGAKVVSIGSVGEIFWADALNKPVIIVMEKDNVHQHPMIQEIAGFIVPTLDEGIEIAIALLSLDY